jgi:prepilin-type N-terminal cleavage/methylation domain-containing protein
VIRTPQSRGFTILEALVAVAILGTAVAAGMSVISTSLRNAGRVEDYQRIVLLSRSQMNELLAVPEWKPGQTWQGTWNAESRWIARVERVPEPVDRPRDRDLMRLLLTATWKTTRGEKSLEFETVRLQAKRFNP